MSNGGFLQRLGARTVARFQSFLYASGYAYTVLREALRIKGRNKVGNRVLVMQILFTGVNALAIVSLFAIALGAVILIQGRALLPQFGQGNLIYTILILVITRELGPILTAAIVMARSGVAITTEIGNMVAAHEIEAYVATGINPISYLVVPRLLGVAFSTILLTVYFNIMGLVGSFVLSQFVQPIPASEYFFNLLNQFRFTDVASSLLKSLVFGLIIALVSTYNGFKVNQSTTEIPVVTISAVGQGFVFLMLANVLISVLFLVI